MDVVISQHVASNDKRQTATYNIHACIRYYHPPLTPNPPFFPSCLPPLVGPKTPRFPS